MAKASGTATHSELRYLINLVGPEQLASLARPLTAEENELVQEALARHGGSHAAALGVRNPELASEIDALFR